MSYYDISGARGANREITNKIRAIRTSSDILSRPEVSSIFSGTKDIINGNNPTPRSPVEAVQYFIGEIFGDTKDPFFYRSKYGLPIYNYLLIKGAEANFSEFSKISTLSSYRTKYVNPENEKSPNTWNELQNDGLTTEPTSFPAVFIDSALVTVSKKKKVIKTNIVNNASSRKEYISSSDYDINITGVFTTDNDSVYPESDVGALIQACEAPIPLDIVSPYLFKFGITRMVVESFNFPNERGSYASQKFSIKACSHAANYLEIGKEFLGGENQNRSKFGQGLDLLDGNYRSVLDTELEKLNNQLLFVQ